MFKIDLFDTLAQDTLVAFRVKDLLKKIDILQASPLVSSFIIEIGLSVNQVTTSLVCKHDITNKLETQNATRLIEFKLDLASAARAEELEKTIVEEDEEFYTCATNIIKW